MQVFLIYPYMELPLSELFALKENKVFKKSKASSMKYIHSAIVYLKLLLESLFGLVTKQVNI